jgi:hypothetical protein
VFDFTELDGAIRVMKRVLRDVHPEALTGPEGAELTRRGVTIERLGTAAQRTGALAVERSGQFRAEGASSAVQWLSDETGESKSRAANDMETARTVEANRGELPELDDALRNGELSRSQAAEVASAAAVDPSSASELIDLARHGSGAELRERAESIRRAARTEDDEEERRRRAHAGRSYRSWVDRDGVGQVRASLTADALGQLNAAVDGFAGDLRRDAIRAANASTDAPPVESFDAYRADAMVALATGAGPADQPADSTADQPDQPDGTDRPPDPADQPAHGTGSRRAPASVQLVVNVESLRRGEVLDDEVCVIPGVGPVSLTTARALLGDAVLYLAVRDGVDVLSIAHVGRSIPEHLKRALMVRDRRCVVPGCGKAYGLEFHHYRVPYELGGKASAHNLCRVCSVHHDLCTHDGYRIAGGPGDWALVDPFGNVVAGDPGVLEREQDLPPVPPPRRRPRRSTTAAEQPDGRVPPPRRVRHGVSTSAARAVRSARAARASTTTSVRGSSPPAA